MPFETRLVPFSDAPIYYRGNVNDPIARLQKQLDRGEATLASEPDMGIAFALDRLKVPISSQTLVFRRRASSTARSAAGAACPLLQR